MRPPLAPLRGQAGGANGRLHLPVQLPQPGQIAVDANHTAPPRNRPEPDSRNLGAIRASTDCSAPSSGNGSTTSPKKATVRCSLPVWTGRARTTSSGGYSATNSLTDRVRASPET